MPAPPPVTVDPGPSIPGLDSLLANIKEYGATLVVAVLAILALWRIAIRLEKSWLAREQLAEAHKAELKLEFEKRIDAYKEVQKISDAMTMAVQGVTMATEHRTEMTQRIADAQADMARSLGRFADTLTGLAKQNDDQCRDLDQLLARQEKCRDDLREATQAIEAAADRVSQTTARRSQRSP
jgi:methyl-accepting chemotaxis protein